MTHILDHFLPVTSFRPRTITDLFSLRLAQHLNDGIAARHYADLADQYSEDELLTAYRRVLLSGTRTDLGRHFHRELQHLSGYEATARRSNLAAIRVERRAVAVAVFSGDQLAYTRVRQLSSAKEKALSSAVGFVHWIASEFQLDSVAVESVPSREEVQRVVLHGAIMDALREHVLSIWEASKQDLFQAFGHPALSSRKELRQIVSDIWPVLAGNNGKRFIQDAAGLGLYVQTERHFILND